MGLYGILVVTTAPVGTTAGTAYPAVGTTAAVTYNAEVPLLLSEIDPVQNIAVDAAVRKSGFSETKVWSGQPGGCGNPASGAVYQTCYPPAVNYTPLYYLFNGIAFDKTHASASLFPATAGTTTNSTGTVVPVTTGITGNVLVRFVNAGLRMHVPSIVGAQTGTAVAPATTPPSGFSLIAEDGNPLPGVTRVQSEVFLAAGKTFDVMVNAPATVGTAFPVFDRELSLSGNAIGRDTGMLAYIGINGSAVAATTASATAVARADTYNALLTGQTLTVSDPAHGLIANDTNVYGVKLLSGPTNGGALALKADGTFTFTPAAGSTTDSFTYCANGTVTGTICSSGITATVTLAGATLEAASGITVKPITYTSNVATTLSIKAPGVLSVDSDAAGYPLTVGAASVVPGAGITALSVDKSGAFNASVAGPGTYTFTYMAQNSQGTRSVPATVTLIFPTGNGPLVRVLDGKDKVTDLSSDYRWVIEEDRTFYVDPTKTTNTGGTTSTTVVPTFGTNFHTSYMPLVAQGCVGTVSCEAGQSIAGNAVVCDVADGACRPGGPKDPSCCRAKSILIRPSATTSLVLPGSGADALTNPAIPTPTAWAVLQFLPLALRCRPRQRAPAHSPPSPCLCNPLHSPRETLGVCVRGRLPAQRRKRRRWRSPWGWGRRHCGKRAGPLGFQHHFV